MKALCEFRVEYQSKNGTWRKWGDVDNRQDGLDYLEASRKFNSDKKFRLVEIKTTETPLNV